VPRVADEGAVQLVDVETHEGVVRTGVEVLAPYGFSSHSPLDGGLVVLLAMGGDQGDAVALPVGNPGARMGGLAPGEAAIHDAAGNRVIIRAGGVIEIQAATRVLIQAPELRIEADTVTVQGQVTVQGNLHVEGDITATGTITP